MQLSGQLPTSALAANPSQTAPNRAKPYPGRPPPGRRPAALLPCCTADLLPRRPALAPSVPAIFTFVSPHRGLQQLPLHLLLHLLLHLPSPSALHSPPSPPQHCCAPRHRSLQFAVRSPQPAVPNAAPTHRRGRPRRAV